MSSGKTGLPQYSYSRALATRSCAALEQANSASGRDSSVGTVAISRESARGCRKLHRDTVGDCAVRMQTFSRRGKQEAENYRVWSENPEGEQVMKFQFGGGEESWPSLATLAED
jgi:hypothetical protein